MAAFGAANAGARVILVEREETPRHKTCGGGVVGRARAMLPEGISIPWERECCRAELRIPTDGVEVAVERDAPVVSMVMRPVFDHALVEAAVDAGAELWSPCEATDVRHRGSHVELTTDNGTIDARFVVIAGGALGTVAKAAGWRQAPTAIPALEWEIRVPDELQQRFSRAARFDVGWTPEGYAWVFPKREHLSVGILSMRRGTSQLKRRLAAYLTDIGIHEIHESERHGFVIPIRPRPDGLVKGRVLAAGDAAGLADPLTAEGISYALLSGKLAAEAIVEGRSDPWLVQQLYEERVERQMLSELRAARKLAWALYRAPRWRSWFMDRFGDDFAEAMAAVISGERTYRDLIMRPRTYWTAVKRRFGRRPAPRER